LERGLRLYRQRDMKGAAKAFREAVRKRKDDPRAWLYLGQALVVRGELKDARKAFDNSLRLDPNFAAAHAGRAYLLLTIGHAFDAEKEAARALELDQKLIDAHYVVGLIRLREEAWLKAIEKADAMLKVDDKTAVAYLLKSEALLGLHGLGSRILSEERRGAYDYDAATVAAASAAQPSRLKEAADNLEKYLALAPDAPDAATQREQLETLRASTETDPARKIYRQGETTTKALVTSKPEPGFTEEARSAGITGVVRLRAVLGADGRVRHIMVMRGLRYGLTEKAVRAARAIKFKPATFNGMPVSQFVILEYNFNIY
ncbi:MAG: TonB family protein, partial [Acidobacteria bacterium]|nr:TonB family protein [Acidobacteriota bacterium]